jgi:predicted anti-sigma-YlaC factor YlaD
MTCETFTDTLSDWLDGSLPDEAARAMREHADRCAACAALERSFLDLARGLGELPREEPAAPDAWPAIVDRIRGEGAARTPWSRWLSMAAVLAIVILGGLLATRRLRVEAPSPVAQPAASASSLPPALTAADTTLRDARAALDEVLAARRSSLSPETIRVLTSSLAEMEAATRKVRDALARDPGNRDLQQMLVASHRRQLAVMRDVTWIAARHERSKPSEAQP